MCSSFVCVSSTFTRPQVSRMRAINNNNNWITWIYLPPTRVITFLVGNPYKPLFYTVTANETPYNPEWFSHVGNIELLDHLWCCTAIFIVINRYSLYAIINMHSTQAVTLEPGISCDGGLPLGWDAKPPIFDTFSRWKTSMMQHGTCWTRSRGSFSTKYRGWNLRWDLTMEKLIPFLEIHIKTSQKNIPKSKQFAVSTITFLICSSPARC